MSTRIALIVLVVFLGMEGNSVEARNIQVEADQNHKYDIYCLNAIGMETRFAGQGTQNFEIEEKIKPTQCRVEKENLQQELKLIFDFGQQESKLGPKVVNFKEARSSETFWFKYDR